MSDRSTEKLERRDSDARPQNLYYPSIFRYKCRGVLHLSSDEVGSAGTCYGIQSRLEHVRDLQRSNPEEAATLFLSAANYPGEIPSDDGGSPHSSEALRLLLQTNALIYDETKQHDPDDPENPWNDWSCYGSTEIHLLVLKDVITNEEKVGGVAPECRLGVSIRDVGTEKSGGAVGTIRAGPLEVNLVGDYFDEVSPESKKKVSRSSSTPSSAPTPNPGIESTTVVYWEKFTKSSQQLSNSMKSNVTFLKDELSDNFPERMLNGSKRVVGQFEKTAGRTGQLMASVYKMWRNGASDE